MKNEEIPKENSVLVTVIKSNNGINIPMEILDDINGKTCLVINPLSSKSVKILPIDYKSDLDRIVDIVLLSEDMKKLTMFMATSFYQGFNDRPELLWSGGVCPAVKEDKKFKCIWEGIFIVSKSMNDNDIKSSIKKVDTDNIIAHIVIDSIKVI